MNLAVNWGCRGENEGATVVHGVGVMVSLKEHMGRSQRGLGEERKGPVWGAVGGE